MQQAAILNGEKNPLDECAGCMMEILNVNDVTNVNLTLESLSQIQYEKLKHGQIKAEFLRLDHSDTDQFYTEDQKEFLQIFDSSIKTKSDSDANLPNFGHMPALVYRVFPHRYVFCLASDLEALHSFIDICFLK